MEFHTFPAVGSEINSLRARLQALEGKLETLLAPAPDAPSPAPETILQQPNERGDSAKESA